MTQHGRRRHAITIQRRTNARQLDTGELYPENNPLAWTDLAIDVPCEIKVVTGAGGERIRGIQIEAGIISAIETQYRDDVTPLMRVVYNGREMNITRVIDPHGRRRSIMILCSEVKI